MAEYTPFQQSFVGDLEIEDYKRHLTMPDDPCSTCHYYPDYYSECPSCGAAGIPTIELTGFAFGNIAFTGPSKKLSTGNLGAYAPSYPFTYPVERDGTVYPHPSTIAECPVRLDRCAQYTGNLPWPVSMSTRPGASCAGQSGYFVPSVAKIAWGNYLGGIPCGVPGPCNGCYALPPTYVDPPEARYSVSIFACYNLHYATSYRPGCIGGLMSSYASSYCTGNDQWKEIFTLPPGLIVYISAFSTYNSCFDATSNWITIPIHKCFSVYHMELTIPNQFGNDLEVTRPLPYYYQNRTGYQLNCNRRGELNLIYQSKNNYSYLNVDRIGSHLTPVHPSFNPGCIGNHKRMNSWGDWNGGNGTVTVNPNTSVVIPARPKAGASASASGTASVG